jgi:hypothetical protein
MEICEACYEATKDILRERPEILGESLCAAVLRGACDAAVRERAAQLRPLT